MPGPSPRRLLCAYSYKNRGSYHSFKPRSPVIGRTKMMILKTTLLIVIGLLQLADLGIADCPEIISRSRWGARRPEQLDYQTFPVRNVIISHTASNPCSTHFECARSIASIQAYQMDTRHFSDIAYNFLIGGDANIYEGRSWTKTGAHTRGWNSRSVGITFVGNFEETPVSDNQLESLRKILDCGVASGFLSEDYKLLGQRQLQSTLSPGLALYQQLQDFPSWTEITE